MKPQGKGAVVVTTIAAPNAVLRQLAGDCRRLGLHFVVAGDTKSPADFALEDCDYYSVPAQEALPLSFPKLCPVRHYARKNVGYLVAIAAGADYVIETDDDNAPSEAFYEPAGRETHAAPVSDAGWTNVYKYYSDATIWPRGLPLDAVLSPVPPLPDPSLVAAPIQQGLANANPDVDAIYRLTMPLPLDFAGEVKRIALGHGSWCPYNSQNTVHYREAFPLLYLPAYCSFRMTDIWRSFVGQRVAWTCGWSILFREPTVIQERNDHDLMVDFRDEIPGYLGNRRIAETLAALELGEGIAAIPDNMRRCYRALVDGGHVGAEELPLLDAWLADLASL